MSSEKNIRHTPAVSHSLKSALHARSHTLYWHTAHDRTEVVTVRADQGTLESDARCDCASINEKAMETSLTNASTASIQRPLERRSRASREATETRTTNASPSSVFFFVLGSGVRSQRRSRERKGYRNTPEKRSGFYPTSAPTSPTRRKR